MDSEFKIGDVVRLKSGGPKMTVTAVHDNFVTAAWFAWSKKGEGDFPFDAIFICKEEEKS
ncbi:MAG: DUF2158 domain-containing protein [Syntrophaceae bacterium]|nr:DUF2158 domain-containing protein [Syntrophaceae bacterium]